MNSKALSLCARFALTPNQLGFCGSSKASLILQNCIFQKDCQGVKQELKKFIILNPYLQTLAQICDLDPFSYQVIEAYWLGNDLLKKCKPSHYSLLLKNFSKQGVPGFLIKELKIKKPKAFIPIHLFNILYVGVGRASGSVPFNLNSINNCMIRWGKVLEINQKTHQARIYLQSLSNSRHSDPALAGEESFQNSYHLKPKIESLTYDPKFTPNLKIGDSVTAHWNFISKKLTQREEKNLDFWTNQLLISI